jgi:hypothetical protein
MSEDDQLLRALGRIAREREREPAAALLDTSPRPLDDLTRARIADDVVAHVRPAKPKQPWLRFAGAAGGIAAAAAIALFLRSRGTEADALPPYVVYASGASVVRGPSVPREGCRLKASEQGAFEVVAQASEPVRGPVGAQAFVSRGGLPERMLVSIDASAQGSIRVTGPSRLLLGASEFRMVIGRGAEASSEAASRHATSTGESGPGWRTVHCAIEN